MGSGFKNDTMLARNVNFTNVAPGTPTMTTDGQLIIGHTSLNAGGTHIDIGNITSPLGTINIGYNSPNITIDSIGSGSAVEHLTGNTGGQLNPTANNFNTLGSGSITISGLGNTLTTQLTGLTSHAVLIGAGSSTITKVGPISSTGSVLMSNGLSSDPGFSTATYPATTTINQLLYSTSTNTITGLSTQNSATLVTDSTGVPVFSGIMTDGQIIIGFTGSTPVNGNITSGDASVTITNGNGSIDLSVVTGGSGITSIGGDTGTPNTGPTVDFHGGLATALSNGTSFAADGSGNVTLTYSFLRLPSTTSGGDGIIYMEDGSNDYPFMHASGGGLTSGSTFLGGQSGNLTTTASQNTGIGWLALNALSTGTGNTAIGSGSSQLIDAGQDNTAVGGGCLQLNTSGDNNCAFGASALSNLDTGENNIGIGFLCGSGITSGLNNILLGNNSQGNCNGNFNTCIGENSGNSLTTTDSNNTLINSLGSAGDNNVLRIGTDGTSDAQINSTFIAGITGRTVAGSAVLCSILGELGTVVSSVRYKENIKDFEENMSILNLRPVEFNYKKDKQKQKQYGLIAEEVHKNFPYLCLYNEKNEPESVKYHELPIFLLNEIKKLKLEIENLKKFNTRL